MTWALEEKGYSQRRACALVSLQPKTYRCASRRSGDGPLRAGLKGIGRNGAASATVALGLLLSLQRRPDQQGAVAALQGGAAERAQVWWPQANTGHKGADCRATADVDSASSGRRFPVLTQVDDFIRKCLGLVVDTSLTALRVRELSLIIESRGCPRMMVSDNGTEFT